MATIHVAVATSDAYLAPCATLIRSLLDQHSDLTIHVLRESSSFDASQPLDGMVGGGDGTLEIHSIAPGMLEGLPGNDRFGGRTQLMRFLLPGILPSVGRILYLDVDTLVVSALDELWDTDLGDAPLAAVRNVVEPTMRGHIQSLGVAQTDAFNSGVMLADLDRIRSEGSFDEVLRVVQARTGRSVWFDQDALNIVFAGRWRTLHPRWNAMSSLWTWPRWAAESLGVPMLEEAKADPAILHFEGPGPNKPWHYLCTHPWRERYRETSRRTPWASVPLEDRSLSTRLIACLPAAWRADAYWRLQRLRRDAGKLRRRIAARRSVGAS